MVSFANGVPLPAVDEYEWGDELNFFLTRLGGAFIDVTQQPYGAKVDGSTVDTTAANAAVLACANAGGGIVFVPPGTMVAEVTHRPRVHLMGAGERATTIKAPAGGTGRAIAGLNFGTLTGKSKQAGDYALGCYEAMVSHMTIDGNKANVSSGYPVSLWGRATKLEHVEVINGKSGGIWTEFTDVDDFTDPTQVLEGHYRSISVHGCSGHGWTHRGPHDAVAHGYAGWNNTGWGLRVEATGGGYNGGLTGYAANSFLNSAGSFYTNAYLALYGSAATAANVGTGVQFDTGTGLCVFEGIINGHDIGAKLSGTGHRLIARIGSGNITNDVQINALGWSVVEINGGTSTTPAVVNMTGNESGPNKVKCLVNLPGGGVVKTGAGLISSASEYALVGQGVASDRFFQTPINAETKGVSGYVWGEYSGTGTPESAVVGSPGDVYQDRTNGEVYVKKSGTATNTGWKQITHA